MNRDPSVIPDDKRRKELFIYFYLYPISEKHPRLINLKETISLVRSLQSKIIFYITSINIAAAIRDVGQEFEHYFSENIRTIKDVLIKENGHILADEDVDRNEFINVSIVCLDYSRKLDSDYFFHRASIDDHLNQKGRRFISIGTGAVTLKMLGKD